MASHGKRTARRWSLAGVPVIHCWFAWPDRRHTRDVTDTIAEANSDEIKGQLRANVEEAEAKGLFGAPSFVIPNANGGYELFWGNDRLEQAVAWAAER